jgi:hypothetical protein
MRFTGFAVVAVAALVLSGCASSMEEVFRSKEKGRSAVYPVAPSVAWETSKTVLWNATNAYTEDHPEQNFLCLVGGMGTDETLVGVWCEPVENPANCRVTVVVRRKHSMQVSTKLTEEQFHDDFARSTGKKRLP